jgi:hypothetical protein
MMLKKDPARHVWGLGPGLLEVLTGSPFGLQLLGGRRPLFDPLGWDPGIGIDAALKPARLVVRAQRRR